MSKHIVYKITVDTSGEAFQGDGQQAIETALVLERLVKVLVADENLPNINLVDTNDKVCGRAAKHIEGGN